MKIYPYRHGMAAFAPMLIAGVPDDVYHGGGIYTLRPQISQSSLKRLLPPSTPATFRHYHDNPQPNRRAFDEGRAAHSLVLGVGEPFTECPAEYLSAVGTMTTKAAKEWAEETRAAGAVPLAPKSYRMVMGMAEALAETDRIADVLTDPNPHPELSAYAPLTENAWLRGRFDLLGGSMWDYKTTAASADPDTFVRTAWRYGYHVQDFMYRWLHEQIVGHDPGPTLFIVQEKEPPYLAAVYTLDGLFAEAAARQVESALALLEECIATNQWPGYPEEGVELTPEPWMLRAIGLNSDGLEVDITDDHTDATEMLADLERILAND